MTSDYIYHVEMKRALERHERREVRVIPVILRPTDWAKAPFAQLLAVPKDAKAITLWTNKDQDFLDAATRIREAAEELSATLQRQ